MKKSRNALYGQFDMQKFAANLEKVYFGNIIVILCSKVQI